MYMEKIIVFKNNQFGEIRTMVDEKGEPWFVGKDVARRLGYINHRKALRDHVDEEDRKDGVTIRDSIGRDQEATFINESGLYSLILASKLPQAKAFKRWVTSEVLPQIRRTGGYIPTRNAQTGEELMPDEIVRRSFCILQRTISSENLPADGCVSMTEVAKTLGLDTATLTGVLRDMEVIKRRGGRYVMTDRYAGMGYDNTRVFHSFSLDGRPKMRPYLVWTPQGCSFVKSLLNA